MSVIALFGKANTGKTRCLGHLINLMHREMVGMTILLRDEMGVLLSQY